MSRLLALPMELLHRIVNFTSIYTTFTPQDWELDWLGRPLDRGALLRLALTCKTLAAVALQLLYRYASTVNWTGYSDTATSLFCTLCSRPDLAAHVTELTLGSDYHWHYAGTDAIGMGLPKQDYRDFKRRDWLIRPDEAALLNKACHDLGITDLRNTELNLPRTPAYSGGRYRIRAFKANASRPHIQWSSRICGALAALAIVKSPNVRRLWLSSRTWRLPCTVPIGSLDKLTEVYFAADPDTYSDDFHLDDSFNWLFAAAPALRKLSLGCVCKINSVSPCTLTELVLEQAELDEESVREMCKSFPALKRLDFGADWDQDSGAKCPYVIQRIVETYKDSLTYLRLDWCWAEEQLPLWPAADVSLAKLKSMTELTELVVATPFLHCGENADNRRFWASLLPPELKVLKLEYVEDDWLAMPLISAVGDNCSHMRSVTVECYQPPADEAAVGSMLHSNSIGHEFCYTVMSDDDGDDSDEFGWLDDIGSSDNSEGNEESGDSDGNEESQESDGSGDSEESQDSDGCDGCSGCSGCDDSEESQDSDGCDGCSGCDGCDDSEESAESEESDD